MNQINQEGRSKSKISFGLVLVFIGIAFLLKTFGWLPHFHFRHWWPVFMILLGLFIGIQKRFTNNAWWILMLIGSINLIPFFSFYVGEKLVTSKDLILPTFLIIGGVIMMFRPKKKCKYGKGKHQLNLVTINTLNTDVVFGGRKEIVTSKDFQGGQVNTTFGGCEINLLQADSTKDNMVLNVRATFGGIEIIVPAHWDVKNEIEPVFGSVEDQRSIRMHESNIENKKTLILKGSCVFGGIEIKSI